MSVHKEMKDCPFCGEEILAKAIKCKHCQSMLHEEVFTQAAPPPPPGVRSDSAAPPPPPGIRSGLAAPPPPTAVAYHSGNTSTGMSYPKAALGKRFLAYLIDSLIGGLPAAIFVPIAFWPFWQYMHYQGYGYSTSPGAGFWVLFSLAIVVGLGWLFFYTLLRDGFGNGQSWGKKISGLMVVNLIDNRPCTKGKSFQRNIFMFIFSIVLVWIPVINFISGWVEPLAVLIHANGHRVGDMVAKTQVIEITQYTP